MSSAEKVRVRFAPSPTGFMHIGNVRAAIFNWLLARHTGGEFLLRVEDTDRERFRQEYVDVIVGSLNWLGLNTDEEPVFQSKRANAHLTVAHKLLSEGKAYPCFCSEEELEKLKSESAHGFKYPGTCRSRSWTKADLEKPHAIRFKIPNECYFVEYTDLIRGKVTVSREQLDDFVIVRSCGMATYNFCNVVDDSFMNISHVIRGEDHISNTLKQILIYEALGLNAPEFAHLPLVFGAPGEKLSKRHGAVSVDEYRTQGFLPDALINYLARLGWSHGDQEVFSREELAQHFTLKDVGKSAGIFDIKKLEWLNGVHLRRTPAKDLLERIAEMDELLQLQMRDAWTGKQLELLVELYRERATTLQDIVKPIVALAKAPEKLDLKLIQKGNVPEMSQVVKEFLDRFVEQDGGVAANLLDLAKEICADQEVKLVVLAQALRLAITGGIQSPGIFELISLMKLESVQIRIERLLDIL